MFELIVSADNLQVKFCPPNACASAAGKGSSDNLLILGIPPYPHPVSCMRLVMPWGYSQILPLMH
jgi:hypothetical protein